MCGKDPSTTNPTATSVTPRSIAPGPHPEVALGPLCCEIEEERVELSRVGDRLFCQTAGHLVECQRGQVIHTQRVQHAVEMVAFVLKYRRPFAVRLMFDALYPRQSRVDARA